MNCSKCNTTLPTWRKPTSLGQMLLGGWTCPNCDAALTHQGDELAERYNTTAALELMLFFFTGIGLSNALYFWASRSGLAMLTLIVTLILGNVGARCLQPKNHTN